MVEIGFTSEINGEMPMIVLMSSDNDPLLLHTEANSISTSATNHPELMSKYLEIATTYTTHILDQDIKLSPNQ